MTDATAEYFDSEDALARWLDDRTVRKTGAWESATLLFNDWKAWADSNGEFEGSQKRFSEHLAARGYRQSRKNTARGFEGIALRGRPVTDGDGSIDYPPHARAHNSDNNSTRHDPTQQQDGGWLQ